MVSRPSSQRPFEEPPIHPSLDLPQLQPKQEDRVAAQQWHEMISKLFLRYDLDGSGTINSSEELQQLTMAFAMKMQQQFPAINCPPLHEIDAHLAAIEPLSGDNEWTLEMFQEWCLVSILQDDLPFQLHLAE